MGQPIELETILLGDVAIFDTNRTITGQDGASFARGAEGEDFPSMLAAKIFGADDAAEHVFVASNEVVVKRDRAWDGAASATVGGVIERFFVFYGEEV